MSQDGKKPRDKGVPSWEHLRQQPEQPKGPPKPWPEEVNEAAEEFVGFLKDPESKKAVQDFLIESYKRFEAEKIAQVKAKLDQEQKVQERGSTSIYRPGNIEPVMHDDLNMTEVEQAFARSLRGTKDSLVRSVEDRVEEINRLLADIGGFSAQLKSSFARSTVVFLEQEDPKHTFRERLIFSINLPNYELKRPWDRAKAKGKNAKREADGRTSLQATWDEAVNALAKIVETTGLKPKYCKNDRNYGRFVMKQDLRSTTNIPDEYFSFTLDYNTEEKIKEMRGPYDRVLDDYDQKIKAVANQLKSYPEGSKAPRYLQLKKKHVYLCQERDFFIGTTPDPHHLDEGLLFLIEVSTLKDYHIVKDRMQSIMTRYILYLSKIAAKEASFDSEMNYQLSKAQAGNQTSQSSEASPSAPKKKTAEDFHDVSAEELERLTQYTVDLAALQTVKDKELEATSGKTEGTRKRKKAA